MRLRKIKGAYDVIKKSNYYIDNPKDYKGHFKDLFKNNNPINLEIGMGKGDFIINMALKYSDINFIGVEKYDSVLIRATEKLSNYDIPNLKLILLDARNINEILSKEINVLYLNFSDPWPKKRHEKRRLTSYNFLKLYDDIFIDNPHIIQKTDNIELFAYSISSLSKYGYTLNKVSLDLANEDIDNVESEYEHKFKLKNQRINYLDAVKYIKK